MADRAPQTPAGDAPSQDQGKSFLEEIIASRSFPYVAPLVVFLALLLFQSEEDGSKFIVYPLKTFLVLGLIIWVWPRLPKIRVRTWLGSILVGVVGFCAWVGLEPYLVWSHDAKESGYHPLKYMDQFGYGLNTAYFLLAVKLFSMTVVVPIAEELFWRGFLMRFLINPKAGKIPRPKDPRNTMAWLDYDLERFTYDDWWKNPLGEYRPVSFWVTTFAFSLVHGDFGMLAIVYGILIGCLFCRTRSLGDAILAHGVTNLLLGIYVISTESWWFW
ncbi:MAG: CPBP family glutamic-type intramembrane protease [Verrucomicrobiota bacterium]